MEKKVAVVGMSMRYPAANNRCELHKILSEGSSPIANLQEKRGILTQKEDYGKLIRNIRCISDIEYFDHKFFGIVKREALEMTPEMRLTLLHVVNAVQDSGYSLKQLSRICCGAVISQSGTNYRSLVKNASFLSYFNNMEAMTGGYLAHYLDLRGPVYSVDSTCSSSLLAVTEAFDILTNYQADYMIAGGIQLFLPLTERESKDIFSTALGVGTVNGCIPFDSQAAGFFSGEGLGYVLLKRYNDAIRDGDHIYGIICGYGMSSNGKRCSTVYAPSGEAQSEAMLKAWKMADVSADDITEFEAHGAATKLGDTAEIQSMAICMENRKKKDYAKIGAVKSNLGHTVHAAGITGLIKVLLEFENNVLYPIAGFQTPNPLLDFEKAHVCPAGKLLQIPADEQRVADIGSYGLNELNIHLVVTNVPHSHFSDCKLSEKNHFLKMSAKTEESLLNYSKLVNEMLRKSYYSINDIIYTLNSGRDDYEYRCLLEFQTVEELKNKILNPKIEKVNQLGEVNIDYCNKQNLISAFLAGYEIEWSKWYEGCTFLHVPAVTYQFRKEKIWPC